MKHIIRSYGEDCFLTFDPEQAEKLSEYEWETGNGTKVADGLFRTKNGRYFEKVVYSDNSDMSVEHLNPLQAVDHYIIAHPGATEEDIRKVFGEEFQCREG